MQLQYLDFDFSDEESGRGSFDAMACVLAERLPPLLAEIAAVLAWAQAAFGPAGALQDEGEWDYELQAVAEPGRPLAIAWDRRKGGIALAAGGAGSRTTLTLTVSGSPAFCEALREAFELAD
ncbi:MAG: hypothetical protein JWP22_1499 [Ramlibacter sp.]|jgi:hypothetical protein|nr:hypothetical protein [Ramlibacter sp.]MDB5912824.1 hypothetical protein [Ramlibacter sp.]